jgi:hypothetical protein
MSSKSRKINHFYLLPDGNTAKSFKELKIKIGLSGTRCRSMIKAGKIKKLNFKSESLNSYDGKTISQEFPLK